ncbi:hypothetical protein BPOR_0088g00150 [Botrytis porri]|uniref:Uncharacterized protein n=1 Tax=Botrytis porri TaxID=87229 RepID=A0A4Z1KZ82_9HELO|nr:hypothetical protein BPOR_0088g00150 [Botrytis porri]
MDYVNLFLFHSVNPPDAPTEVRERELLFQPQPVSKKSETEGGTMEASLALAMDGVPCTAYRLPCEVREARAAKYDCTKHKQRNMGNETSWQCGNRVSSASDNQIRRSSGGWLPCPSFSCGMHLTSICQGLKDSRTQGVIVTTRQSVKIDLAMNNATTVMLSIPIAAKPSDAANPQ